MTIRSKWICSFAAGIVMSLGSAPMAYADDTDLFIANADPQVTGALPNILFVIDTSGSMTNEVLTQEAWNTNVDFEGCYRSNALYFSTAGVQPGCGSNNWIPKTSNRCAAAAEPLAVFGRYDDNFLAWRNRRGTSNDRWVRFDVSRERDAEIALSSARPMPASTAMAVRTPTLQTAAPGPGQRRTWRRPTGTRTTRSGTATG